MHAMGNLYITSSFVSLRIFGDDNRDRMLISASSDAAEG
jgi:hypothetical protein